jgi:hypothetical protein
MAQLRWRRLDGAPLSRWFVQARSSWTYFAKNNQKNSTH